MIFDLGLIGPVVLAGLAVAYLVKRAAARIANHFRDFRAERSADDAVCRRAFGVSQ